MNRTLIALISATAILLIAFVVLSSLGMAPLSYAQQTIAPLPLGPTAQLGDPQQAASASTVVLDKLPPATANVGLAHPPVPTIRTGVSDAEYQARKAAAAQASASRVSTTFEPPPAEPTASGIGTVVATGFFGQDKTCGNVAPADTGLAVGVTSVVQVVNTCISVYTKGGALKSGYPKSLNPFFGLPATAATSQPRALYDWANNRFIIVANENRGVPNQGHLHVAASATSDPTGAWFIYDLQQGAPGEISRFPDSGDRSARHLCRIQ